MRKLKLNVFLRNNKRFHFEFPHLLPTEREDEVPTSCRSRHDTTRHAVPSNFEIICPWTKIIENSKKQG